MISTLVRPLSEQLYTIGQMHEQRLSSRMRSANIVSLVSSGATRPAYIASEVRFVGIASEQIHLNADSTIEQIAAILTDPEPKVLVLDYTDKALTPSVKARFLQILLDHRIGNDTVEVNRAHTVVIVQSNYKGLLLPGPILNKTVVLEVE